MNLQTLVITFFSIMISQSCSTAYEDFMKEKSKNLQGLISEKFLHENHAIPTFRLGINGKKNYYLNSPSCPISGLWDHSEVGDSLIKPAGSLEYKLVKPDTVLYFYPECVSLQSVGIIENPKYRSK